MKLSKIIKRFRIDHPHKFRLADIDPGDTCGTALLHKLSICESPPTTNCASSRSDYVGVDD